MKKAIVGLGFLVCIIAAPAMGAEEVFDLSIECPPSGGYLKIDLNRLSRDEVKHFMQKLAVYKNDEAQLEENLINQNHLNEITKYIPFQAQSGDLIKVVIHYGDKQHFDKEYLVPDKPMPQGQSRIIGDDMETFLKQEEDARNAKRFLKMEDTKAPMYGYEMPGNQEIGQKGYGYEGGKDSYGGKMMDPEYGEKGYGYKKEEEKPGEQGCGYRDAGHYVSGQKDPAVAIDLNSR